MDVLDITLPDTFFDGPSLITEWDKLNYKDVTDTDLRDRLNEVKELCLCQLSDPPPTDSPEDETRGYIMCAVQDIFDQILRGPLSHRSDTLMVQATGTLILATIVADTTLEQRLEYAEEAQAELRKQGHNYPFEDL